ncbi:hypothetical protein BC828DRAFT_390852, partial [Blastocladiella britannica]
MDIEIWFKGQGGTTCLSVHEFQDTGRGMKATRSISKGDVVLEIPRNLLVTRALVERYAPGASQLPEQCALALFLYLLKTDALPPQLRSFWSSYLGSLPSNFDSFLSVLPTCTHLPTEATTGIGKQLNTMNEHFDLANRVHELPDPALWQWCWLAVNSRCIFASIGRDTMALAPLLDMINHHPQASTRVELTGSSFRVLATEALVEGTQFFFSYGPHSNWDLWLEYGFVVPGNTSHVSAAHLVRSTFSAPQFGAKWALLGQLGLDTPLALSFPPTYALRMALTLFFLPSSQDDAWTKAYQSGDERPLSDETSFVDQWIARAQALLVRQAQSVNGRQGPDCCCAHALQAIAMDEIELLLSQN